MPGIYIKIDQHRLLQNPYLFITILSSHSTLMAVTSADETASVRNLKVNQLTNFMVLHVVSYSAYRDILYHGTEVSASSSQKPAVGPYYHTAETSTLMSAGPE
jgi:hypothetical protein